METRIALRIDIDLKVVSKIDEDYQQKFGLVCGKTFEVKGMDVSELGVGILSKYFLPKGLIIEAEIDGAFFGLSEIMKIKGEVRHCRYIRNLGYRCGLKFLNLPDTYRKAIVQTILVQERRKAPRVRLAD